MYRAISYKTDVQNMVNVIRERDNVKPPTSDGGERRMDNYVKITRLLYLQTEVIKAIQRVAGMPTLLFLVNATWRTVNCRRKRTAWKERAEAGEECGVDGTNGGSSEG